MNELLLHYHKVHPATWAYLSSLLVIALFFIFSRVWRVRNLDLLLLILLAPGLLLVTYGRETQAEARRLTARANGAAPESAPPQDTRPDAANPSGEAKPTTTDVKPVQKTEADTEAKSTDSERPASVGVTFTSTLSDEAESKGATAATTEAVSKKPETGAPAAGAAGPGANSNGTADEAAPKETPVDMAARGLRSEKIGFFWLWAMCGVFLIRLLLDPTMVRRPLLEPNLGTGGMVFMGCALFVFLMANVVTSEPTDDDLSGARGAQRLLARTPAPADPNSKTGVPAASADLERHGPGYALLSLLPSMSTATLLQPKSTAESPQTVYAIAAKVMALLSHLAVVVGMIAIGYWHFDNIKMGVGAALLYLLLPYTSVMTGRVDHVLPAALLVWAVLNYRRPLAAGVFIGLAAGVVYYPLFLLPLWFSFYRQRGVWRFTAGLAVTLFFMTLSLALISESLAHFWAHVQTMFGLWLPKRSGVEGVWGLSWDPVYRLPVLTAFIVLSCTLALWPARKNLGTLLSCSAALMIATQFWHGYGGGLYMGWFLPLTLLTMFRPNLEDRVALSVLGESWFARRRLRVARVGEAA